MQMKVLFLIALMVQTAVYCVAVYQSMQDYLAWTLAEEKFINELLPEGQHIFINYGSYLTSLQGKLAFVFGVSLASSWIILGIGSLLNDRKKMPQT